MADQPIEDYGIVGKYVHPRAGKHERFRSAARFSSRGSLA